MRKTTARLGGLAAAEVIQHIGARPEVSLQGVGQKARPAAVALTGLVSKSRLPVGKAHQPGTHEPWPTRTTATIPPTRTCRPLIHGPKAPSDAEAFGPVIDLEAVETASAGDERAAEETAADDDARRATAGACHHYAPLAAGIALAVMAGAIAGAPRLWR